MQHVVELARRGIVRLRPQPQPYCQVCFGPEMRLHVVHDRHSKRKITVRVCTRCGYVELPDASDDLGQRTVTPMASRSRREREMSKLGLDLLDRPDASVLALGEHPEAFYQPYPVARRYDVVVAADMIDRFEDPRAEFARLFNLMADDGVLICSSTIYDGRPLSRCNILGWAQGSYYSLPALRRIGSASDVSVDVRVPPLSSKLGPRRRYVIFSRSLEVMGLVAAYFAGRPVAVPRTERVNSPSASA
jgi:hypothetical protein